MAASKNIISVQEYRSKFGDLLLGSINDKLCLCDWIYRKQREQIDHRIQSYFEAKFVRQSSSLITETIQQLEEYSALERKQFTIPMAFAGTDFQQNVWQQLFQIPYGSTTTYLRLSQQLGDEKVIRAVATANGANAISILVPCHRVVGADGSLVGYAGGLQAKKKLLELEANSFQQELFH